ERQRRHLEVRVVGDAAILPGEELRRAAQLRQLALDAAEIVCVVLALIAGLHGTDRVEQRAVDLEHLLVVLDLLRVLEEGADHPGVGQDDVDALDRFLGGHGCVSGVVCGGRSAGGVLTWLDGVSFFGGGDVSPSSLEYRTSPAPSPTRMMPRYNSG